MTDRIPCKGGCDYIGTPGNWKSYHRHRSYHRNPKFDYHCSSCITYEERQGMLFK